MSAPNPHVLCMWTIWSHDQSCDHFLGDLISRSVRSSPILIKVTTYVKYRAINNGYVGTNVELYKVKAQ